VYNCKKCHVNYGNGEKLLFLKPLKIRKGVEGKESKESREKSPSRKVAS